MGQEIDRAEFSADDFAQFHSRLQDEMSLLRELFDSNAFSTGHGVGGYELEAWLVDQDANAAPVNQQFIERLNNPLVVHELSRFNVELNSYPHKLIGRALSKMQADMTELWHSCNEAASTMNTRLVMMGTLPVLNDAQLTLANMSEVERYRALNEQVLKLRRGKPIQLDIKGRDHLQTCHYDVMLEAAATSFQIHLQVSPEQSVRYYNSSLLASLPLLAVAANSPFLFGKDLWDESRIPLFEQAVNTDSEGVTGHTGRSRVTFGHDWCRQSVLELYEENIDLYPVLLPTLSDADKDYLWHLRLHNGTIWRWNRPLIGIDESGYHLRIEQRVIPSGPTIVDMIANAAFYFGLITTMANEQTAPESLVEFNQVKEDFYSVARKGLRTSIHWPGRGLVNVRELIQEELLPAACQGLRALGIHPSDIDYYLAIIQGRVESGQNGAGWQRSYLRRHTCSMRELTEAYISNQESLLPVHKWQI